MKKDVFSGLEFFKTADYETKKMHLTLNKHYQIYVSKYLLNVLSTYSLEHENNLSVYLAYDDFNDRVGITAVKNQGFQAVAIDPYNNTGSIRKFINYFGIDINVNRKYIFLDERNGLFVFQRE